MSREFTDEQKQRLRDLDFATQEAELEARMWEAKLRMAQARTALRKNRAEEA
ncbi:MAG: hypothetical protein MRY63_02395 [Neomegalonema sp.]|nr:hypothetical protein [Neomegalonema sp.]